MNTLYIKEDKDTPEVYLASDVKLFYFKGSSFPTNPMEFYEPIINWFTKLLVSGNLRYNIGVDFKFDYFNTSTLKQFIKLFRIIEDSDSNKLITINWYYNKNDFDMLNSGKRLQKIIDINFIFMSNGS